MATNAPFDRTSAVPFTNHADASVTADTNGLAVNFATAFRVGTDQTTMAGAILFGLIIDNSASTNAVDYNTNGNTTDGATELYKRCPAGQVRFLRAYDTAEALKLKRTSGSDQTVILTAVYSP